MNFVVFITSVLQFFQTNWKTYTDDQYHITFSYCSDWAIYKNGRQNAWPGKPVEWFSAINKKSDSDYLGYDEFVISFKMYDTLIDLEKCPFVFEQTNDLTVDSIIRKWNPERNKPLSRADFKFVTQIVELDGRRALTFYCEEPAYIEGGPSTHKSYYVQYKNHIFDFGISSLTGSHTTMFLSEFEKVIETIRFEK